MILWPYSAFSHPFFITEKNAITIKPDKHICMYDVGNHDHVNKESLDVVGICNDAFSLSKCVFSNAFASAFSCICHDNCGGGRVGDEKILAGPYFGEESTRSGTNVCFRILCYKCTLQIRTVSF